MTEDEARDQIIQTARWVVDYWAELDAPEKTCRDRISGAIFSFLAELDGVGSLPCCDIVLLDSDDDGNTIGETRVSTMLHEYFHPPNPGTTG